MSFNILTIPPFDRQLKRLLKKYPSLKEDFKLFLDDLEKNPAQGKDLGKSCFKIRIKISSKNKGKSGGARIITHIVIAKETVYLISIYDKGDQEIITDKELENLLTKLSEEL